MGKYNMLFSLDKKIINLGSVLLSVKRAPYLFREKQYLQKNKDLKEYKKNERCYIIGLGPSLNKVDFDRIDGDVIVTNRFVNYERGKIIKPNYYCLQDVDFYSEENNPLPNAKRNDGEILRKLRSEYDDDCALILNGKYRHETENIIGDANNNFFTYMWSGYFDSAKKLDFTKPLPIMGNIVCFAIMTALYLEYKEIVLLGCDFNSFASRMPTHCYMEKSKNREISMSFELFCYSFVADTHRELNQYAIAHNIKIINATDGSLIDAYEYSDEIIKRYML